MGIRDYSLQHLFFVYDFAVMILLFIFILVFLFFTYIVVVYSIFTYEGSWVVVKVKELWTQVKWKGFYNKFIYGYINQNHNLKLEIIWTVFPVLGVFELIFPSLSLVRDERIPYMGENYYTVSVLGNQWYWDYEYHNEFSNKSMSSNIVTEKDIESNNLLLENWIRLLSTNKSVVVPVGIQTAFFVTSNDVIHSWAIPGLAIKIDAVPGRINWKSMTIGRVGLFSGMCSEICGIDHSFMPISISALLHSNVVSNVSPYKVLLKELQWSSNEIKK